MTPVRRWDRSSRDQPAGGGLRPTRRPRRRPSRTRSARGPPLVPTAGLAVAGWSPSVGSATVAMSMSMFPSALLTANGMPRWSLASAPASGCPCESERRYVSVETCCRRTVLAVPAWHGVATLRYPSARTWTTVSPPSGTSSVARPEVSVRAGRSQGRQEGNTAGRCGRAASSAGGSSTMTGTTCASRQRGALFVEHLYST